MSNDYRIGLAANNMADLVDDPFSEITTEQIGFTLAGNPITSALDTINWEWKNMSQEGWYQIWLFWTTNILNANPPPYVYIRSLVEEGDTFQYATYRCRMGKPVSQTQVPVSQVRDAQLKFYQCERV